MPDPALTLAASPIQGGPLSTGLAQGPQAGPVGPISTPPGGMGGIPPEEGQDAMGTPEGAIAGTTLVVERNYLASMVHEHFSQASMARQEQEGVWSKCHDNYRGTLPRPVNEQSMRLRSKVTMKITRTKVAAAVARHKDIGFKWAIKPTPEPNVIDFTPSQLKSVMSDILASMQDKSLAAEIQSEMDVDAMVQQVKELAKSRSNAMQTRISDDLVEMRHDASYDQGLLDDALYGTMVFKGPLTKERRPGRWIRKGGAWGFLDVDPEVKLYRPEAENVSVWDFYPSPGAWLVEKMDYGIIRHVMGHRETADLSERPGFEEAEVFACLADKTGSWKMQPWESKIFASNGQTTSVGMGLPDKFEVYEWWGYIKVSELKKWGGKVAKIKVWSNLHLRWEDGEPNDNEVVIANIWVCGNHVLRAWHTPLKPRRLPFYVVPYERIPKSLWGQGVAWMMEDWQAVMNTTYRAMMDNMAISALPMGWFDRSRLRSDDKGDLFPGKMFEVKDSERLTIPPVQFYFPPNNVAHMRLIAEIARANIQESTSLPDLVQGMQTGATHNRTAAGMSMLGGWADTSTRSVQKNIDQEYTKPFIRSLYFWEMQFSNDDRIKGDFDVEALGVESVMADEVLTQRLVQYGQMMQQNPETAKRMNWGKFGAVVLKKMGLADEDITFTESQVRQNDQKAMQDQLEMQKQQNQPQFQPEMSEKDWLLKCLDRVPEDSPIMAPLLRKVLTQGGAMTKEINAAINMVAHNNAQLAAGQLSDTDQAALEAQNANADGSGVPDNGGDGVPSGVPAAGGPVLG